MAWIELHQTLPRHPKLLRLANILRVHRAQSAGHLTFLWLWALDYAPSGELSALTPAEISAAAEWPGDAEAFVAALRQCGWLDDGLRIHDWEDYAGRIVAERTKNRDRMRRARAQLREETCDARAPHTPGTVPARAGATVPNPTQPEGSLPCGRAAVWPTLEECLTTSELRGIAKECAEKWWHEHDARGGLDKKGLPMERWESSLIAYATTWRANEHRDRQKSAAVEIATKPAAPTAFTLKTQADALDRQIADIRRRGTEDAFGWHPRNEEDRQRLRDLKAKRKEIDARLATLT